MGQEYTDVLRQRFGNRVSGEANLVTYWFEVARRQIDEGKSRSAGLVATSTIRQTASRAVLERIRATTRIFEAWSDERWINEGAAVRVSLICFGNRHGSMLDGRPVATIFPDLTGHPVPTSSTQKGDPGDFTYVRPLAENADRAFPGSKKHGSFDVPGDLARQWLKLPNPHGRSNADMLKPLWNGLDVTRRPRDVWVIDFGTNMAEAEAALYERPFEYVRLHVKPERETNNREQYRRYWWRHGEPRIALRRALRGLHRYMAISEKSKHFYFIWLPVCVLPDNRLIVIARADDITFGTVSSRFHRVWALRVGSKLEDRPCYTPTTCFQTFPFPTGLTPNIPADAYADHPRAQRIAVAAKRLNEFRENWLNSPDLVVRVPEVAPGYPDRLLPKDEDCAKELKKRTLTNLYNQRPTWLDNVHKELDAAVAAAYGWPADLNDDEILARLFDLNQGRKSDSAALECPNLRGQVT